MVAGVFSRCMLVKHLNSHYRVETECCHDPAVYERINEEIKHWIWKKAPGVRDSRGCPKKEVKSMKNNSVLFISNNFFGCFLSSIFILGRKKTIPPVGASANCRCGVEWTSRNKIMSTFFRIVGGIKIPFKNKRVCILYCNFPLFSA